MRVWVLVPIVRVWRGRDHTRRTRRRQLDALWFQRTPLGLVPGLPFVEPHHRRAHQIRSLWLLFPRGLHWRLGA
jgi:hypothetical protein